MRRVGQRQLGDIGFELPDARLVPEQCQSRRHQALRGLGIPHHQGRILVHQRHRIVRLVVFRHVRRRDKDGSLVRGAQLGNGARTAAGNDHIGHRIRIIHAPDKVRKVDERQVAAGHKGFDAFLVVFAALPDDFNIVAARATLLNPMLHGLVQRTAAQASAHNEQMIFLRIQSVVLHPLQHHLGGGGHDIGPDRIAAHNDLIGREKPLHTLVRHADATGFLPHDLVGEPGKTILLLDERRDAFAGCLPQQGSGSVSAYADGDIGLELVQDSAGLADALEHFERHLQVVHNVVQVELALQPQDRQAHNLVAGCGHLLHLHLTFCTDEKDLRVRIQFLELVGDGNGREDVPARSAAADNHPKCLVFHIFIPDYRFLQCR